MPIQHIFVIGAGTMGNGIAQVAATSGYDVTCMDVMPAVLEKAKAAIAKSTSKLLEKGTINADQKAGADKINFVSSYDSLSSADFVIEAATENPDLKFKIFKELDAAARQDVILATNTSSISITKIAAGTKRPDKVIGMHFMNPVPLMKLVEVIKGLATSEETLATTLELCKVMGKEAWSANDSPGFISNRILCPDDQRGDLCPAGRRWHARGHRRGHEAGHEPPHGSAHPGGFDRPGCGAVHHGSPAARPGRGQVPPRPLLRKMVDAGYLGRKAGEAFTSISRPRQSKPGVRNVPWDWC